MNQSRDELLAFLLKEIRTLNEDDLLRLEVFLSCLDRDDPGGGQDEGFYKEL